MDEGMLRELGGWSVRGWSLLQNQLFTLALIDSRPPASTKIGHRLANVFFVEPTKLELNKILRSVGQPIDLNRAEQRALPGGITRFEFSLSGGASIVVVAKHASALFF
jgi:hypothetical protein